MDIEHLMPNPYENYDSDVSELSDSEDDRWKDDQNDIDWEDSAGNASIVKTPRNPFSFIIFSLIIASDIPSVDTLPFHFSFFFLLQPEPEILSNAFLAPQAPTPVAAPSPKDVKIGIKKGRKPPNNLGCSFLNISKTLKNLQIVFQIPFNT
ncbi:hypothetical protein CEXT_573811 [Caerostris extrusa]|uniref:Uncharacterized protein n=2 Tax=Caerostris extrusa TaxID=172846 RepID=A0AAV4SEX4_CAEEX|nr:hypothetical protein CEXT_573811 [Caerostris extrusa]